MEWVKSFREQLWMQFSISLSRGLGCQSVLELRFNLDCSGMINFHAIFQLPIPRTFLELRMSAVSSIANNRASFFRCLMPSARHEHTPVAWLNIQNVSNFASTTHINTHQHINTQYVTYTVTHTVTHTVTYTTFTSFKMS